MFINVQKTEVYFLCKSTELDLNIYVVTRVTFVMTTLRKIYKKYIKKYIYKTQAVYVLYYSVTL